MPAFGATSLQRLSTCDSRLQRVFLEVVKHFDCTVLEGHRDKAAQDKAFAEKKSKLQWPNGMHNKLPSLAVDAAPVPIDWNDRRRFDHFAGFVLGVASQQGVKLRWGGDWNRNTQLKDESFLDLVHFELVE